MTKLSNSLLNKRCSPLVVFAGRPGRDVAGLADTLHLAQVDGALAVEVLPGLVVAQLVLDRVQHEPPRLPRLQQRPALVQVALTVANIFVPQQIFFLSADLHGDVALLLLLVARGVAVAEAVLAPPVIII